MNIKAVLAALAGLCLCLDASAFQGSEPPEEERERPQREFRVKRSPEETNAGPCPSMGVLYDASRQIEFSGGDERYAAIAWTAEMRGVRGLCRYREEEPIVMTMEIDMGFGRGPAAQGDDHVYRYWVAVTRKDRSPLAKQYFELPVEFPGGEDRVAVTQTLERILIPRAGPTVSGANFEILVGFDVTPEQLAFNRAGKRFRVDAGQND